MLSNGNRLSAMDRDWDDAIPIARAYIEAAPDRVIWGSDWPHVQWRKPRMMNDGEVVELLYRYVDNDQALLQKILVDNPARLHGFKNRWLNHLWDFESGSLGRRSLVAKAVFLREQQAIQSIITSRAPIG